MQQIEPVLRTARLEIDLAEKLAYKRDDLWEVLFIGGIFGRLLQHGLKEQRIARKAGGRFCQIRIEFEFARVRPPLRFLSQPPNNLISKAWASAPSKRTSTNWANAGFELFSFSNSYLPYNWCAP